MVNITSNVDFDAGSDACDFDSDNDGILKRRLIPTGRGRMVFQSANGLRSGRLFRFKCRGPDIQ